MTSRIFEVGECLVTSWGIFLVMSWGFFVEVWKG